MKAEYRGAWKRALVTLPLLLLTACLGGEEEDVCRFQRNQPDQKLQTVNLELGTSRFLSVGQIFSGVGSPNVVKNLTISGEPSFVKAIPGSNGISLTADRLRPEIVRQALTQGEVTDTVSVSVETKCGNRTVSFQVRLVPPSVRRVLTSVIPFAEQILPARPAPPPDEGLTFVPPPPVPVSFEPPTH